MAIKTRAEISKKWRGKNPNYHKEQHSLTKWGLTLTDQAEILAGQGGGCAICGVVTPGGRGGWHVDHNHAEGHVRGLLCARCNLGLGYFRDSRETLTAAARYLEEYDDPDLF